MQFNTITEMLSQKASTLAICFKNGGPADVVTQTYHDLVLLVKKLKDYNIDLYMVYNRKLLCLNKKHVFGDTFIIPFEVAGDRRCQQVLGEDLAQSVNSHHALSDKHRRFLASFFENFTVAHRVLVYSYEDGSRPQVRFGAKVDIPGPVGA